MDGKSDLASGKVRKETVELRPDPGSLRKQTRPRVRLRSETGKENHIHHVVGATHTQGCLNISLVTVRPHSFA